MAKIGDESAPTSGAIRVVKGESAVKDASRYATHHQPRHGVLQCAGVCCCCYRYDRTENANMQHVSVSFTTVVGVFVLVLSDILLYIYQVPGMTYLHSKRAVTGFDQHTLEHHALPTRTEGVPVVCLQGDGSRAYQLELAVDVSAKRQSI